MLDAIDNPHLKFKSIHIAGTNGKGSVSHILASAYQAGRYKVGIFTSPHIFDFRERVKINGELISEEAVVDFINLIREVVDQIGATFFEITTALAFHTFAERKVDIAIIETGLGGRLDSTNVILPALSVITNIGLDHQSFLGHTIELIAFEKAGIIKTGIPVLIGRKQEGTNEVFAEAAKKNSTIVHYSEFKDVKSDLLGMYQKENLSTALKALSILHDTFPINKDLIQKGLNQVAETTNFRGRFQMLAQSPLTMLDAAHNSDGVRNLLCELERLSFNNLHIVYGSSNDKEVDVVFALMPKTARYYLTTFDSKRSLNSEELAALAVNNELSYQLFDSSRKAYNEAKKKAAKEDMILIFGSFYIMNDILD
ncbi:MAG: dihydrofolate synthase/folylpolyglutamate synthase [Arenicella sp.]